MTAGAAPPTGVWDLAVVGAGPAGASAALGALRADPSLSVVLLDRADFPRDKSCGDGVAPHVVDLLEEAGVQGVVADRVPVPTLRLTRGSLTADRVMPRPAWVVPREVLDARLVAAAVDAGAVLHRHRVRTVVHQHGEVHLDGTIRARVVVGADGANSVLRRAVGLGRGRMAVAIRGYAPLRPGLERAQVIAFDAGPRPAYAWSFDRGDGLANVGYGEFVVSRSARPSRAELMAGLDRLLPGASTGGTAWWGHQLPLSDWRPLRLGRARVLLAGDAAGLVNPMTGEGIYYAVATGLTGGRCAATALRSGTDPVPAYTAQVRRMLGGHLRDVALGAWTCRSGRGLDTGIRAAAGDQRVFDDLVELGLAQGRLTPRLLGSLVSTFVSSRAVRLGDALLVKET